MTRRDAGFAYARELRNPDFRAALKAAGHIDGEPVWISECGDNINDELADEGPGSYFVATADEAFDHGFRFCRIDVAGPREEEL